ncbi:S8 family serine peptidase [Flavitalea sp. BT771]|uniref:S8 family serine peptidase n=1 Tax=Flavitalea sp. BT771 TaxID=3063329 RepID=UPI0026E2293C|nr:S8 family serine peptidase [Flavitalea sp. BT771]MDO6433927.1 S8 family serine peptidase [Flavitalea sp. BT771]MDV6222168.1 S8 family serine peptidase [Flavitalea sp. BT771]
MTNWRPRSLFLLSILLLSALFSQAQVSTNRAALQQASRLKASQEQDIRRMVETLAAKHGWPLTIKNKSGRLAYLRGLSRTGHPIYITTNDNIISAATIRTTSLWPGGSTGLGLSGSANYMSGLIAVWDEGKVRNTHVELNNRVNQADNSAVLSDHSTHVAGTMIAAGVNPVAKGMSFGAKMLNAYDFNSDQSEMMTAAQNGLLVSNHSYSIITGWYYNGDQSRWEWWGNHGDTVDVNFGLYDEDTRTWDSIAYNAPFYLITKAAGNNRSVNGPDVNATYYYYDVSSNSWKSEKRPSNISNNAGYMIIATYGNAKNILTVGAVNPIPAGYSQPSDAVLTDFSSWGPTGDGRIKPDVVADGANVLSSVSTADNAYDVFSGTSMASPAAAGSSFLLQEYWSKLHGNTFMRSATLKGLLIHTADEAGANPGPDYQYGWGLINMEKAASVITSNNTAQKDQMVVEDQLTNTTNDADSITVVASGTSPLIATISWTDPAGVPAANVTSNFHDVGIKLVNDLDLRITDVSSGTVYLPWILNPASPSAAATRGDNIRDNVEKVQVDSLIPGRTYKIKVSHKGTLKQGTPSGSQAYSLLVSGAGGTAYCASGASGSTGSFISNVNLGSLNNATAGDCGAKYNDQTAVAAPQLAIGQTFPIKVGYQTCSGTANTNIAVYIDYNNNGDFGDAGELAASTTNLSSTTTAATYTGSITIPTTVKAGVFTRMRIVVQDGAAAVPAACGTYTAGETQDYRVMFSTPASDVGVASLELPGLSSCASDSQIVTIRIRNYGTTLQNAVPVTTTIKDGGGNTVATLTAICKDSLPGKSDVVFTYNTTFKAIAGTTYTLTSKTGLATDFNTGNDQYVASTTVSTNSSTATGTAFTCGTNATTASLKATTSGNDVALWYDSPTATKPIAAGNSTTTSVIPSNNTYYLGVNDLATKEGPPNKMAAYTNGTGAYYQLQGNFIKLTTQVPLTIESAKMYFSHSGKVTFTLATFAGWSGTNGSYSYIPNYSTTIDVYATRNTPLAVGPNTSAPADNNDTGGIFNLNIPIPTPGSYIIIIDGTDGTGIFANVFGSGSSSVVPYPISIPGLISITGNDQGGNTADSTTAYKKIYYPFYNMGIRLTGCPSTAARTPVVATPVAAPVITLTNTNVFTSSFDDGNQWYRSGTLLRDSTGKTLIAKISGTYQTIVTDAVSGCALPSNSIPFVSTGTNDVNGSTIGLVVSPNPNPGIFQLQFNMETPDNTSIILLNTLGQKVYEEDDANFVGAYNKTINAGNLASGMYVLKIIHGNDTYVRKILVKK